jgi:hypothetical protein
LLPPVRAVTLEVSASAQFELVCHNNLQPLLLICIDKSRDVRYPAGLFVVPDGSGGIYRLAACLRRKFLFKPRIFKLRCRLYSLVLDPLWVLLALMPASVYLSQIRFWCF